jgi:hypothetical protein
MTTTLIVTLSRVTCAGCGVIFGLEASHESQLRESHETFYCPNGHRQHFPGQTDKERRIAELEREKRNAISSRDFWLEQSTAARREVQHKSNQLNGYRGVVTRMKRKLVAGRCPCCSHQFKDLERHMAAKHPKWNPDVEANHRAMDSSTTEGASR